MSERAGKPLGRKAYGSIPHLPDSRIGPGEHHIHEGQARICTKRPRDRHDRVIVTEKLDGANVAVANIDGELHALGRQGYPAHTAPYEHIRMFGEWVHGQPGRFLDMLEPGEVLHGEWMALAHGTRYELAPGDEFVAFDLTRDGKRVLWEEAVERCERFGVATPVTLSDGPPATVEAMLQRLDEVGRPTVDGEDREGAVWRVERRGGYDFLAKFVRSSKVDGAYLPEISGEAPIWLWRPEHRAVGA